MRRLLLAVVALASVALLPNLVIADNAGQADLDAAADLQITAETLGDLEKVVKLAESALENGARQGTAGVCQEAAIGDAVSARQPVGRGGFFSGNDLTLGRRRFAISP